MIERDWAVHMNGETQFRKALRAFSKEDTPYDLPGRFSIVVDERYLERLDPLIEKGEINVRAYPIKSMSELTPDEQHRIRHQIPPRIED